MRKGLPRRKVAGRTTASTRIKTCVRITRAVDIDALIVEVEICLTLVEMACMTPDINPFFQLRDSLHDVA